jgi:NitT/TauT family transport system ATP-binding protein
MTTFASRRDTETNGLAVDDLRFSQGGKTVLEDLRLRIAPGEFVCLFGPSGSGKTTLLRLLAGLELPDFGYVSWNGRPVVGQDLERGLVFQDCGLLPWLTLMDNMVLAIDAVNPNMPSLRCQKLARDYLNLAGLDDVRDKRPLDLSRAMRQRGSIARALALGSPVLLLDDPFCALDPAGRAALQDLLATTWAASDPRRSVVLATQDLDDALYLADRIIGLPPAVGPIVVDETVAAPRPLDRNALYGAPEFQALRQRINDSYRQERRRRMAAQDFFGLGEGI